MRRSSVLVAVAAALLAPAARAETDWFASLYTSEGVELRADERIFTLYALLNAMGYDDAPVLREFPVPAREMDPVRLKVRSAVRFDAPLEQRVGAFFSAHPLPAEAYARYALGLKGPASFERSPASGNDLKGVEALLAETYGKQKLGELFAGVQDDYRAALKTYHAGVDAPIAAVRKLLRIKEDEPPRVVLVVNLLDGRGKTVSAVNGEELFVVVGPARSPDLFSVAREVSRASLEPLVAAKAAGVKALPEAAAPSQMAPAAFATEALARAWAAAALGLSEAGMEPYSRGAFAAVPEVARAVEAGAKADRGLEALVNEALAALTEPRDPAKKPKGR